MPAYCEEPRANIPDNLYNSIREVQGELYFVHDELSCIADTEIHAHTQDFLLLWGVLSRSALAGRGKYTEVLSTELKTRLNPPLLAGYNSLVSISEKVDRAFEVFANTYREFLTKRPSPSSYALPLIWREQQEKHKDLLCLRPTKRSGPTLSTLHTVFLEYTRLVRFTDALPLDFTTGLASRAASYLCLLMGDAFKDEAAHSNTFDQCIQEIFPGWRKFYVDAPDASTVLEHALLVFGNRGSSYPFIIREDIWELGQGDGDAYIHDARNYQLFINYIKKGANDGQECATRYLASGAPMFLLGVVGSVLFVSGAFYDGQSCIVEPLGTPHWMLHDNTGVRQQDLARVLRALYHGVTVLLSLFDYPNPPYTMLPRLHARSISRAHESLELLSAKFPPCVPRLYSTCYSLTGGEIIGTVRFLEPIEGLRPRDPRKPLLFVAGELSAPYDGTTTPLSAFVKLTSKPYGEMVQMKLADKGFAPVLHGLERIEGAPTAYGRPGAL